MIFIYPSIYVRLSSVVASPSSASGHSEYFQLFLSRRKKNRIYSDVTPEIIILVLLIYKAERAFPRDQHYLASLLK